MPAPTVDTMRLHMRTRPGMYIGGLNPRGMRQILDGIVTELLDRPGARPDRVRCVLAADGSCEVDVRGGAIPAVRPEDFDPATLVTSPADDFFSLAVASAFSDRLDAEVVRDGRWWSAAFAAGLPVGPVTSAAAAAATADPPSVRVRYRPDPALFKPGTAPGFLALCGRAREWAAFHPHTRFTLVDEAADQRRDFHYPAGLLSLAEELGHAWHGFRPAWRCRAQEAGRPVADVVLIDRPGGGPAVVQSYVNGYGTTAGGSHVDGLRVGVAAVSAGYTEDDPANPFAHRDGPDPLAGLSALVAVWLDGPSYATATSDELLDERARELVRRTVAEQLPGEIARAHDGA